jgi:hypothetical protein
MPSLLNMDMKSESNFYIFISLTDVTLRDVISRTYIAEARVQNSWWDMKQCASLCCSSPCLKSRLPLSWIFLLLAVAGCRPNERKTWFTKKKHEQPPSVPAPNSFFSLAGTSEEHCLLQLRLPVGHYSLQARSINHPVLHVAETKRD